MITGCGYLKAFQALAQSLLLTLYPSLGRKKIVINGMQGGLVNQQLNGAADGEGGAFFLLWPRG